MSIIRVNEPPPKAKVSYIIPQLQGEMISIPGSKSVFRVLTSAIQTEGAMSVFSSGSVLADAPGFHHHNEAHDIFIVVKGYMKLWNGDRCKILGPGDFASVPPGIIHNPHWTGPITESFGLVTPGEWLDFFRYIGEVHNSIILPEDDDRPLRDILIPKVLAAKGRYDVVFHPEYQGCAVSAWDASDETLPDGPEPYYLRANTGPRWMLGGVMSRPFCTTAQTMGKFAISSIESSSVYKLSRFPTSLKFPTVHHCFCVFEGVLEVALEGESALIREGETVFIAADTSFSLKFRSKYVRFWSFASGEGIEALIHAAGQPFAGLVLPDTEPVIDDAKLRSACEHLKIIV